LVFRTRAALPYRIQVLSPAKAIFVGTGVLLSVRIFLFFIYRRIQVSQAAQAAQSIGTTQDTLLDVFNQMELFFRRLEAYPEITNAKSMKDINEKILLAVLSILTIVTEEIKQGRASELIQYMFHVLLTLEQKDISKSW
jgi:hypothetical protein